MKLILFVFALVGFAAADPPTCLEDGNFPDPDNCANYYVCTDGEAIQETCPFGLFFNEGNNTFASFQNAKLKNLNVFFRNKSM